MVAAVRLQFPSVEIVQQIVVERFLFDPCGQFRIEDRESDLDPTQQIALQPVGAGAEQVGFAVIAEPPDAAVFEKSTNDRTHADVVRYAGHARAQRTGAAHDQIDAHAGLRGLVQRSNDLRFVERIHLGDDASGLACVRECGFALDPLQHPSVKGERRLQQTLEFDGRRKAGDLLENLVYVAADFGVCGDESEVGVGARRAGVIVARAQMGVADELAATFAAHDQQHLRVGLVADHAVNHLHTRVLKPIRQAQIGFFVEACAQFDHHGHVFTVSRRLNQVLDDRRILPGAVQRLLDRQHIGVFRCLFDQLQHRCERIERMMHQHVAGGGALEDGVHILQLPRLVRRKLEVRASHQVVDLACAVQIDRTLDTIDRVLGKFEIPQQRMHDRFRTVGGDLQPHRAQITAPDQFVAQRQREILDFLFVDDQF